MRGDGWSAVESRAGGVSVEMRETAGSGRERKTEFRPLRGVSWTAFLREDVTAIAGFFRVLMAALPAAEDFHMRVLPAGEGDGFIVRVVHGRGAEELSGPVEAGKCMSCDLDTPLAVGVKGDAHAARDGRDGVKGLTSRDSALPGVWPRTRCWLDAKARAMFIVTPEDHHEDMQAMGDEELAAMWMATGAVIHRFGLQENDIASMVLNQGVYRNHAHLHVKMRIPAARFANVTEKLGAQWRALWDFAAETGRPDYRNVLQKSVPANTKVSVGDLVPEVSEEDMQECLAAERIRPVSVSMSTGSAILTFESHEEAARCICHMYRKPVGRAQFAYFWWAH